MRVTFQRVCLRGTRERSAGRSPSCLPGGPSLYGSFEEGGEEEGNKLRLSQEAERRRVYSRKREIKGNVERR